MRTLLAGRDLVVRTVGDAALTAEALGGALLLGGTVVLVAYGGSPELVLALPLGMAFLALAVLRPVAAVCISLLLVVAEAVQVPLGPLGALSATEVAFLMVAFGWCWRALTGVAGTRHLQIADYPMAAFVLALLPGLVLGVPPAVVLRLTVMYGAFLLVFLTVKAFSPRELRTVVIALGISGGLLALGGLYTYVSGGGVRLSGTAISGRAAFGISDPNYFGAYLQLAALPLLALLVAHRGTRARLPLFAAVAAAGAAIVFSFSRGALLGTAVAVAVVVLAWSRTRVLSAIVLLVVVLGTAANINPLIRSDTTEVVARRISAVGSSSNDNRLILWDRSLETVVDRPQGVGALEFKGVSRQAGITERGRPLENAHNTYLNVAVELGVFGLVAYLLWMARVGWDIAVEWRRRRPETFGLAVGAGAAFIGYSLQAMTIVQYRVQPMLALLFVLAGVAAAARAAEDDPGAAAVEPQQATSASAASSARA